MKKLLLLSLAAAMTTMSAQAVTLNVDVPSGTGACFVVGEFNGWNVVSAPALTKVSATRFTLNDPSITEAALCQGYKYVCGPAWTYVEKGPNGEELANRTSIGNPDVVARWASVYAFNENIKETVIRVAGYDRKVRVLLPEGYATASASYPVIYYVGVQQRFNDAGNDADAGDDLFGSVSWNLPDRISSLAATYPAIVVATYSFVGENMPYANAEFIGSGASDSYLDEFITKVKGYVDGNYRTLKDAEHTAIMGADLGGVLATYATLRHPSVFGRCLAMSPVTWVTEGNLEHYAAAFSGASKFVITRGTAEPATITDMTSQLAAALPSQLVTLSTITSGRHDDESWGSSIAAFYPFLAAGSAAPATAASSAPRRQEPQRSDIANTAYTLYSKIQSSSTAPANSALGIDGTAAFSLVNNYRSGGADVTAKTLVRVIPKSVTTYFFWNVKRDADGSFLKTSPGNVSFKSSKSSDSWLRVVVFEDESVKDIAASSTGFRVKNGSATTGMTVKSGYTVTASVNFATADKRFTIRYGSVNSNSDMGDITESYSVSSRCTAATIDYDFLTNRVTVTETSWGDILSDDYVISAFQAIPSVITAGRSSHVVIKVDADMSYSASLTASKDYGAAYNVPLTATGTNSWTADMTSLSKGFYTLQLSLSRGSAVKNNVSNVCIRVTEGTTTPENVYIVANAYADVDWSTTGRYKANFHTHTSQSFDTKFRTDEVVDRYKNAGYKILALTDHDANSYPWNYFDIYNPQASVRDPEALGMLAIPGVELSKDNRNNWSEWTGGEFNHHNDFFTGRKGQEFASLQESYAYTNAIGGMQIINHPGQYWSLDKEYTPGEKNSAEWHAANFKNYPSLIGLEVYNQGNRRPNDRILWDQILDLTMPGRPVWGYSCDDTHTAEQYFRNYEYMLMPELTVDALKQAMRTGALYFCYEYTGSGQGLAPKLNAVIIDEDAHTITLDTEATNIKWISSTDRSGGPSTRKSTAVGRGKTFDYSGFEGSYVRAVIFNDKGETCTQPFGFAAQPATSIAVPGADGVRISMYPNPAVDVVTVAADEDIDAITLSSLSGATVMSLRGCGSEASLSVGALPSGAYLVTITTPSRTVTKKLIKR